VKQGLVLDKVVLLGRTLEEYQRQLAFDAGQLRGKAVLDVASGVSSFCAEASLMGVNVTACDPIYELPAEEIRRRCGPDLEYVLGAIGGLKTYRWEFYETTDRLRGFRERSYRTFLDDYEKQQGQRYVPGRLPHLPFKDGQFDLTLVSYLLFVYEDHLDYEFHKRALLELMRVTRGEARVYPLVSFEAVRSSHLDRLLSDPGLRHLRFEEMRTDFEFMRNSNSCLRIVHR
jgi:hypothetical protein